MEPFDKVRANGLKTKSAMFNLHGKLSNLDRLAPVGLWLWLITLVHAVKLYATVSLRVKRAAHA